MLKNRLLENKLLAATHKKMQRLQLWTKWDAKSDGRLLLKSDIFSIALFQASTESKMYFMALLSVCCDRGPYEQLQS